MSSARGLFSQSEIVVMLLALCHRCWTWIEPKHERCVECGVTIDLQQPDPNVAELKLLFGPSLGDIGEVSLKRPRLPSFGVLTALENGLLFLPDLRQLPSGGIVAVETGTSQSAGSSRMGFWNLFARRTQSVSPDSVVRPPLTEAAAAARFLNSPGALFIPREAIVRIIQRGTMFRVERKPGKTQAWRLESPPVLVRDNVRALLAHPSWNSVPLAAVG